MYLVSVVSTGRKIELAVVDDKLLRLRKLLSLVLEF